MTDLPSPRPLAPTVSTLTRALSWVGLAHVGTQILWWGSLLVLAALLTPSAFGTVATGMAVVTTAGLIMEAGSRGSLIAAPDLSRRQLRRSIVINVVIGTLLAALIFVFAQPLIDTFAPDGDAGAIQGLSLNLVVTAFAIAPMALLQRALLFKRVAAVRVGASSIAAVTAIVAAAFGAGVWALVMRQLLYQALAAAFAWAAARRLVSALAAPSASDRGRSRRRDAIWFAILAATTFLALGVDNLIVGNQTNAGQLGLYTFAFTLAFAPLTQVSWQLGQVLFPAAAASSIEVVGRRTLRAMRVIALLLLPPVAPAVVLAPTLIPGALGEKWEGAVPVFQLLLIAGVAHALLNVIGESLAGAGAVGFRAKVNIPWSLATAVGVFVLVQLDGIRGAALAHLLLVIPFAGAYILSGARRVGTDALAVWTSMRPVLAPVGAQAVITLLIVVGLRAAGVAEPAAAVAAAVVGLAGCVALLALSSSGLLREDRAMLANALTRGSR